MATITALKFDITSGWSGDGVDDAQAQLRTLKQQIEDLNSKRLQITADATETQATIADVKKQIDDLNQDVKLGVADEDAKTKLLELKAELDALNNRALAIKVDKSQADAELAALKLEMDKITQDQKIKVEVDNAKLRDSLDSAKSNMDQATKDMSNDWDGVGKAGRAASLNLVSAVVLLLPVLVPLSEAVLSLGGAVVSAFAGAGIAAGVFAVSVKQTISSAATFNSTLKTQNATLLAAQQQLDVTKKSSTGYANAVLNVQQAQAAVNQTMSQASPAQRQVASGLNSLTSAWKSFQQSAAAFEAPLIEQVMKDLAVDLNRLLPIIPAVTNMLKPFVAEFTTFSNAKVGGGIREFVGWVITQGVPNLQRLIIFVQDIGKAFVQIAGSFAGQGTGLTQWLDKIGTALDKWGSNGGFLRFAAQVSSMMPQISKAMGSLGLALAHVVEALHGFGGTALTQLTVFSAIIAGLPVGVIEAFFVAFEGYKVVAAATAVFKAMAVVVDVLKVAYAASEAAVLAFTLGTEGATAAEGESVGLTAGMAAGRVALAVATGVATAATAVWGAVTATTAAIMDVMLGPIGLIILAVAALGFGIYELVDHWSTVWKALKSGFDDAWAFIKQWSNEISLAIAVMFGPIGLFIALGLEIITHWSDVKQWFDDFLHDMIDTWNWFYAGIEAIWHAINTAWDTVLAAVKSAWDTVSSALSSAWTTFWNTIKDGALAIWQTIVTLWTVQIDAVKSVWDAVSSALSGAWNAFWNTLKDGALAIWDFLVSDWNTQLGLVKSAWDTVSSAISGAWSTFWNTLKTGAQTVWNDITSGVSGFASGIESAFTTLVSTVQSTWNGIESVFQTPVNFIIRIWNDVAGAIGLPTINTGGSQGSAMAEAGTAASNHAGVLGKAGGGYISGPGGPREDAIPARLSNGEYVMQASAVEHYGVGAMNAMNEKKFAGGGIVGDITGFVSGLASGAVHVFGDVTDSAINALKSVAQTVVYDTAKPVINGIVSAVPNPIPGVAAPGGQVPHAAIATLGDKILDALKGKQSTAQQQAATVGGTIPTGEHLTLITQALAKAGVPQSQWSQWEAGLNTLITRESGWNPTAVNNTDSNAAAGNPSKGLMQTTGTTFAEYSLGGSITDPVSNMVAGIRYILAEYGSIGKVQQANANLPPKGYDNGGPLLPGMTLANNTTGTVEGVLNPTGLAAIGGLNALSALNSGGGFKTAGGIGGGSTSTGGTTIVVQVGGITVHADGLTQEEAQEMLDDEFEKLAVMIEAEVGAH